MSKNEKDIALFVAFCIEEYGATNGMASDKVLELFLRYGVIDYLSEFFDTLHTQGRQWLIEEITEFIDIRRKKHEDIPRKSGSGGAPRILPSNRLLDYGIGFYTTTSEQQSREWVARRMSEHEVQVGYVNIYEFDDRQLRELKCLLFSDGVETLIRELKTYRLVDQYLFHTERGLSALRFTEAIKIEK